MDNQQLECALASADLLLAKALSEVARFGPLSKTELWNIRDLLLIKEVLLRARADHPKD